MTKIGPVDFGVIPNHFGWPLDEQASEFQDDDSVRYIEDFLDGMIDDEN
jgi:hypothetical protein